MQDYENGSEEYGSPPRTDNKNNGFLFFWRTTLLPLVGLIKDVEETFMIFFSTVLLQEVIGRSRLSKPLEYSDI